MSSGKKTARVPYLLSENAYARAQRGLKLIQRQEVPPINQITPPSVPPEVKLGQCGDCLQTLLRKEGNHRIANSLQLASSLVMLRARATRSAEVRAVLDQVANDIGIIGQIHRRLCMLPVANTIDIRDFVTKLCSEIEASTIGGNGAKFTYKAAGDTAIYFDAERASQIGLIVTELLTNSAKHAGVRPECFVAACVRDNMLELTVTDNGPGRPENVHLEYGSGVGMILLKSLASGLEGTLTSVPSDTGAQFLIRVPMQSRSQLIAAQTSSNA